MHRSLKKPYIGIAGITSRQQVETILSYGINHAERPVMIGVLASSKTLSGRTNKYPHRTPPIDAIKTIFGDDPGVINFVHYHSEDADTLAQQLDLVSTLSGNCLDGFQINNAWPSSSELWCHRIKYPHHRIVLQLNKAVLSNDTAEAIAKKLKRRYLDVVQYVLIDASGGLGSLLDTTKTLDLITAIQEHVPEIKIAVAGGLGPDTLSRLEPLIVQYPELSIDAESGVRDPVTDLLDLDRTESYLRKAVVLLMR